MAEPKTKPTKQSAATFVAGIVDPQKRADSKALLKIFKRATGQKPVMWGTQIVGFGMYHYKSERSSQEGDWPITGFSPRVQNMTVYVMPGYEGVEYAKLLTKLGPHSRGKSCLYFKRLSGIDASILEKIIKLGYREMKKKYL